MSHLSDRRVKRFLKKSASEQYRYAKSLTPAQRGELEQALEDTIRSGSEEEARSAMTMWLSVQQARLRTHSLVQRLQYELDQTENIGYPVISIIGTPVALPLFIRTRNRYYANADRPEYHTAFNNFMAMIGDGAVSQELRDLAASRLTYHARSERTIAASEMHLLRAEGPAGLADRGYRVEASHNQGYIGSLSDDLNAQQRPLGVEINQFLLFARERPMLEAGNFNHEDGARAFARVLARCHEETVRMGGAHLHNHPTIRKGVEVVHAIAQDSDLRKRVFVAAIGALGSCTDAVAVGFAEIVNEVRNHKMAEAVRDGHVKDTELREWAGEQFRFEALKSEVDAFCNRSLAECERLLAENRQALMEMTPAMGELAHRLADPALPDEQRIVIITEMDAELAAVEEQLNSRTLSADSRQQLDALHTLLQSHQRLNNRRTALVSEPVETMLHAQTALRETLRLPDSTPRTMQYQRTSALSGRDLQQITDAVRKREADPETMRRYLLGNETWRVGIRSLYPEKFDRLEERYANDPLYDREIPPDGDLHAAERTAYAAEFKALEQRQRQEENELFAKYAAQPTPHAAQKPAPRKEKKARLGLSRLYHRTTAARTVT